MQMIGEEQNSKPQKGKTAQRFVLVLIILLVLITGCLYVYITHLNSTLIKFSKDGQLLNSIPDTLLQVDEEGEVYISIKDIASILGYDMLYGEYNTTSTAEDKCYIKRSSTSVSQIESEIAAFELGSNKILKTAVTTQPGNQIDYNVYETNKSVKKINDKLYATVEGISIGFNVTISISGNKITVKSLDYLVSTATGNISSYGMKELSPNFNNQKALLYNLVIGKNTSSEFGVIGTNGTTIVNFTYQDIEFEENAQIFIVKLGGKYGVLNFDGTTLIKNEYDKISIIDRNLNYLLVENGGKKGVLDKEGTTILYTDYSGIGVDINSYKTQNIKNSYILLDNVIPVVKDNKLGMADIKGNIILPIENDSLGCKLTSVDGKSVNSVLVIPDCEGIVYVKNGKYGIVNKLGEILIQPALDSVYSITESNTTQYFMKYNGQTLNVMDYLKELGLITVQPTQVEKEQTNTTDTNSVNNTQSNTDVNNI